MFAFLITCDSLKGSNQGLGKHLLHTTEMRSEHRNPCDSWMWWGVGSNPGTPAARPEQRQENPLEAVGSSLGVPRIATNKRGRSEGHLQLPSGFYPGCGMWVLSHSRPNKACPCMRMHTAPSHRYRHMPRDTLPPLHTHIKTKVTVSPCFPCSPKQVA